MVESITLGMEFCQVTLGHANFVVSRTYHF
jgi:hypothetical protein